MKPPLPEPDYTGDRDFPSSDDGYTPATVQRLIDETYKAGTADAREWLPIADAPQDQQLILSDGFTTGEGFWHDGSECHGHRGGAGWFWESDRANLLIASNAHATHYMPLPPLPTQRTEGGAS